MNPDITSTWTIMGIYKGLVYIWLYNNSVKKIFVFISKLSKNICVSTLYILGSLRKYPKHIIQITMQKCILSLLSWIL